MTRRIDPGLREPVREHHRAPHRPADRRRGRRSTLDLDEVFEAAARTGTALEINAYPDRLDLRDEHILWAKRHGVKFAIDTDSHATPHLRPAALRRRRPRSGGGSRRTT